MTAMDVDSPEAFLPGGNVKGCRDNAWMADVLVLVAHPDLARSRVSRALVAAARSLPADDVEVRDLYALYPDYLIDVEAEQRALAAARTVVWVHPVQWYTMPALMKLWLDEVFAFGWAYGPGAHALAGKCVWLVASTGGPEYSYLPGGSNGRPFEDFLPAYAQTAAIVGMRFLEPRIFHGAHRAPEAEVQAFARGFARRLSELAHEARAPAAPHLPTVDADERRVAG
jgi:glutathione-regulated potassium-efflux system ancillary protein KefF